MPRKPQDRVPPAATPDVVARLKAMVESHGSLRQVGLATALSSEQIGRWVTGRAEPRFSGVAALARLTGHSLDWIAYGEGPERLADGDDDGAQGPAVSAPEVPESPGLEERVRAALGADTPSEFAARHGVDVETVVRALYGDLAGLIALAPKLGWSLDWLLLGRQPAPVAVPDAPASAVPNPAAPQALAAPAPEGPALARLVHEAVLAVERQIATADLVLDTEDRASMTAILFRALLRKAQAQATSVRPDAQIPTPDETAAPTAPAANTALAPAEAGPEPTPRAEAKPRKRPPPRRKVTPRGRDRS